MALMGSSFGNGFHGRPAGGHLPKPLHELLPNSWKLVPSQPQLANEHTLTRREFTCLASHEKSPGHLVKKYGKYKMSDPKFSSFISYTIFQQKLIRSVLCFDILFSFQRFLFREILRD